MEIQGGMWGAQPYKNRTLLSNLGHKVIVRTHSSNKKKTYNVDQTVLRDVVWPFAKKDVVQHDSYYCSDHRYQASHPILPFPTRRQGHAFIGKVNFNNGIFRVVKVKECPIKCRPKNHQDWIYC